MQDSNSVTLSQQNAEPAISLPEVYELAVNSTSGTDSSAFDVTIVFRDDSGAVEAPTHRVVAAAGSPTLRAILSGESRPAKIALAVPSAPAAARITRSFYGVEPRAASWAEAADEAFGREALATPRGWKTLGEAILSFDVPVTGKVDCELAPPPQSASPADLELAIARLDPSADQPTEPERQEPETPPTPELERRLRALKLVADNVDKDLAGRLLRDALEALRGVAPPRWLREWAGENKWAPPAKIVWVTGGEVRWCTPGGRVRSYPLKWETAEGKKKPKIGEILKHARWTQVDPKTGTVMILSYLDSDPKNDRWAIWDIVSGNLICWGPAYSEYPKQDVRYYNYNIVCVTSSDEIYVYWADIFTKGERIIKRRGRWASTELDEEFDSFDISPDLRYFVVA